MKVLGKNLNSTWIKAQLPEKSLAKAVITINKTSSNGLINQVFEKYHMKLMVFANQMINFCKAFLY